MKIFQQVLHVATFDELTNEVKLIIIFYYFKDLHEIWVLGSLRNIHFMEEITNLNDIVKTLFGHLLHCVYTRRLLMLYFVNVSICSFANRFHLFIWHVDSFVILHIFEVLEIHCNCFTLFYQVLTQKQSLIL